MNRPQRQRHPHRPLQLEVHEVEDPVRQQSENRGRHQRSVGIPGEVLREHEHADARQHDPAEEQHVVDENRIHACPQPGRRQQSLEERGVRIGERPDVRRENVPVDQLLRIAWQDVRNPGEAPDAEQRIVMCGHSGAEVQGLRPRQDDRQRNQESRRTEQRMSRHARCRELPRGTRRTRRSNPEENNRIVPPVLRVLRGGIVISRCAPRTSDARCKTTRHCRPGMRRNWQSSQRGVPPAPPPPARRTRETAPTRSGRPTGTRPPRAPAAH